MPAILRAARSQRGMKSRLPARDKRLACLPGLVVLCAFVSPFRAERRMVRDLVGSEEFIEIFVDTPVEVCIQRDPKGLYAKAREHVVRNVTGVDSPYEPPEYPELRVETRGPCAERSRG
jgi:bifunctional enzyme CysN/CysC